MKHEQLSEQQIPDDLSLLYGIVQTHFGEGLAPVTNNGVKALIERIAKAESKVTELEAKIAQARKEAFVRGAKWWEFASRGATMWQSDQKRARQEAEMIAKESA